nr:hypothetical protein [Pseudomonas syringae pv. actinidiae]
MQPAAAALKSVYFPLPNLGIQAAPAEQRSQEENAVSRMREHRQMVSSDLTIS